MRALYWYGYIDQVRCQSSPHTDDVVDQRPPTEVENFALFTRLMDDPRYHGKLYGDISALTESSRVGPLVKYVIRRIDWHDRLLNGSDYLLPGYMPGVSVKL